MQLQGSLKNFIAQDNGYEYFDSNDLTAKNCGVLNS